MPPGEHSSRNKKLPGKMTLNLPPPALNNPIKLPISAKGLLSLLTFLLGLHIIYCVTVLVACDEVPKGVAMRYVWRILTRRCTRCGQRLNGHRPASEAISEVNNRVSRLTETLGRSPFAQNCHKCNRMVFEGEPGFTQRYLLSDIV